ncbi:MAG: hypothetical protein CL892_05730 [Dehalococcoidia bacterium]|nr:hypothetical protein [Dehalococcoidia bacterium]
MSDKINKLHRYMRIGINRTGSFPSQPELMKKLGINPEEFNELINEAKESGRDIRPEYFEINQYSKISYSEIKYGTEEKEPFGHKDFINFHKNLSEKILDLNFGDDDLTEDILELAGTLVKYLEIQLSKIDQNEDSDKLKSYDSYSEVMSVYGIEKTIPTNNQIQVSVDNFLSPFKDIFNKIGIIYESYDTHINEPFTEDDIINNYETLNFNEINSLLKLYEDGQLS